MSLFTLQNQKSKLWSGWSRWSAQVQVGSWLAALLVAALPETSEAGPAPRRVEVGAPAWVGPGRCVALVLLADCRGGIVGGCWDDGGLGGGDLEGGGCNASCGCNLVDRSVVGLDDLAVLAARATGAAAVLSLATVLAPPQPTRTAALTVRSAPAGSARACRRREPTSRY